MKRDNKETARILTLAIIGMLMVSVFFRLWRVFTPEEVPPTIALQEALDRASLERSLALLKTPLARWNDSDRAREPKVAEWLETQSRTVLPWEWSNEARTKDPQGYADTWVQTLQPFAESWDGRLKAVGKERQQAEGDLSDILRQLRCMTNSFQLAREKLSAGELPVVVTIARLQKGRFWGWNRRESFVAVSNDVQRLDLEDQMLASEHAFFSDETVRRNALATIERRRFCVQSRCDILKDALAKARSIPSLDEAAFNAVSENLMRILIETLNAVAD